MQIDPHSVANIDQVQATFVDLQLLIDFSTKVVTGKCKLNFEFDKNAKEIKLDVADLKISDISSPDVTKFNYTITPANFGQCLAISPPKSEITISYTTSPGAPALAWLEAHQTLGKQHPMVFSQSQAIQGRSLWPCQDTPSIKTPFKISATVPKPLTAICSGLPSGGVKSEGGPVELLGTRKAQDYHTFTYSQDIPVQSYLVSVTCGAYKSASIGPRSKIWTEEQGLDAAQKELDGIVEPYITTAEKVVGNIPYQWGCADVVILPKNMAYGGMEIPCALNMSASLLAGDKSLTTTLAHEYVHSWSGNWTTNATWSDFWLNEGFTRYIERRILGDLNGEAYRGLLLTFGYFDLKKNVDYLVAQGRSHLTRLAGDMSKLDPDEAFSRVPYENGSLFLYYLERKVAKGDKQKMTEWLGKYFRDFAKKSITTEQFQKHFTDFFPDAKNVDWNHWLQGEGLPDFDLFAEIDTSMVDSMQSLAKKWQTSPSGTPTDFQNCKAHQIMVFLDTLIDDAPTKPLSKETLSQMDQLYHFSSSNNVEIAYRWWLLCLKCKHVDLCLTGTQGPLEKYLGSQGRGVYVKPLYQELASIDKPRAKAIFEASKSFYMEVVSSAIAKMVA